jgi:release factor glutamine methyltransferase
MPGADGPGPAVDLAQAPQPAPRVRDWLAAAQRQGLPRLDAQWLLGHHLQRTRSALLAHDEEPLPAPLLPLLQAQLQRRLAGEPLAYVLGEQVFCGLHLQVTPAVLVPRPETELLVDWAVEVLPYAPAPTVADLGTGSGAIALALAQRLRGLPGLQLTATDASAAALAVARANGNRLGLPVQWLQGPWWQPLAGRRWGLITSNPPYVAEGDPHLAALRHEPASALTAGPDGLADLRVLAAGAPAHLLPGGWLLLEHGHDQGPAVQTLLRDAGFQAVQTRADLAGLARCTGGRI